ncbi:MAG: hypothetical protein IKC59_07120 [Clostridia bacterium]|nr:hypothetical protein [Clostridia bacterium]
MEKHRQSRNQEPEDIDDEDFFDDISDKEREIIKRALLEIERFELRKIKEKIQDIKLPPSKQ